MVPRGDEPLTLGQRVGGKGVIELIAREDIPRIQGLVPLGEDDVEHAAQQSRRRHQPELDPKRGGPPPNQDPGERGLGRGPLPWRPAELTLELLRSVGRVFGEDGLERLIVERERDTLAVYEAAMKDCPDLDGRVRKLARLRQREGYMAEWRRNRDGSFLLIENHCPICAAATECQGLCRSELAVFQRVLGDEVAVERLDHIHKALDNARTRRRKGEARREKADRELASVDLPKEGLPDGFVTEMRLRCRRLASLRDEIDRLRRRLLHR